MPSAQLEKVKFVKPTDLISDYIKSLPKELDKKSVISLTATELRVPKQSVRYIINKNEETKLRNLDQVM